LFIIVIVGTYIILLAVYIFGGTYFAARKEGRPNRWRGRTMVVRMTRAIDR
jgi:hypothetical protein